MSEAAVAKTATGSKNQDGEDNADTFPGAESTRYEVEEPRFRFDLVPNLKVLHAEYNPGLRLADIVKGFTCGGNRPLTGDRGNASSGAELTIANRICPYPLKGKTLASLVLQQNKKSANSMAESTRTPLISLSASLASGGRCINSFSSQRAGKPNNDNSAAQLGSSRSSNSGAIVGTGGAVPVEAKKQKSELEKDLMSASRMSLLCHLSIHLSGNEDLKVADNLTSFADSNANTFLSRKGPKRFSSREDANILTFFNEIEELKFFAWSNLETNESASDQDDTDADEPSNGTENESFLPLDRCMFELSTGFPNLKLLDLSGQGISKLSPRFSEFVPNLRIANFAFNKLGDEDLISVLGKIPRLTRLFMCGNNVKHLDSVLEFFKCLPMKASASSTTLRSSRHDGHESDEGQSQVCGSGRLEIFDLRNNPVTENFYPDVIQVQRSQEGLSQMVQQQQHQQQQKKQKKTGNCHREDDQDEFDSNKKGSQYGTIKTIRKNVQIESLPATTTTTAKIDKGKGKRSSFGQKLSHGESAGSLIADNKRDGGELTKKEKQRNKVLKLVGVLQALRPLSSSNGVQGGWVSPKTSLFSFGHTQLEGNNIAGELEWDDDDDDDDKHQQQQQYGKAGFMNQKYNNTDATTKNISTSNKSRRTGIKGSTLISVLPKSSTRVYKDAMSSKGLQAWRAMDSAFMEQQLMEKEEEEEGQGFCGKPAASFRNKGKRRSSCSTRGFASSLAGKSYQEQRIHYWAIVLISCPSLKWLDGYTLTKQVDEAILNAWREMV